MNSLQRTALLAILAAALPASAEGIGTIRADYSGPMNIEINAELNAIPLIDLEVGVSPATQMAHGAVGPRFFVLPRDGEAGFAVKLHILAGAWAQLGSPVSFYGASVNPGISGTYWFAKSFGVTATLAVPVFIPIGSGSVTAVSAFPRIGAGFSF
jgi:hypothetical protein